MDKFVSDVWPFIWGGGLIIVGICFIWKKEVAVGFEDQKPILTIKGIYAKLIGLVVIIVGILILLNPNIVSRFDSGW